MPAPKLKVMSEKRIESTDPHLRYTYQGEHRGKKIQCAVDVPYRFIDENGKDCADCQALSNAYSWLAAELATK